MQVKNDICIFVLKIINGLKWLYLALILQKKCKTNPFNLFFNPFTVKIDIVLLRTIGKISTNKSTILAQESFDTIVSKEIICNWFLLKPFIKFILSKFSFQGMKLLLFLKLYKKIMIKVFAQSDDLNMRSAGF